MGSTRFLSVLGLLAISCASQAENWPQWRGPHFNGSSDERDLPSTWSKETAAWTVDLPGPSAATPVIWGDRVFTSTADSTPKTLNAQCINRKTGRLLWNRQ